MASSSVKHNSATKRILSELRELQRNPSSDFHVEPLEDNLFEWHFTLRGAKDTPFDGGLFHGKILLPPDYPYKAPSVMLSTPNGRFQTNTKLCISFTAFHAELWQPAWGIRTILVGLQGFFPVTGAEAAGVGGIDTPPAERRRLAALSRAWKCEACGGRSNEELLEDEDEGVGEKEKEEKAEEKAEEKEKYPSASDPSPPSETADPTPSSAAPTPAPAPPAPAPAAELSLSTSSAPPTPTPAPAAPQPEHLLLPLPAQPSSDEPPLWLDALIIGIAALLVGIIGKKVIAFTSAGDSLVDVDLQGDW